MAPRGYKATIQTEDGEADLDSPEGKALLEGTVRRALGDRLWLHSELSKTYVALIRLGVDGYTKLCISAGKAVKKVGGSDMQVNSLQNLANAGYLAIVNAPEGAVPQLGNMTEPQRDAMRNVLAYLHGEYETLIADQGTLLSDATDSHNKLEMVQAMFTALLPQRELGEE